MAWKWRPSREQTRHIAPLNLALAPDEGGTDDVIPHRAHQGSAEARQPPVRGALVDHGGDPDVRDRADRADQLEADQAGEERPTGEPLVVVGEYVVEHESPGDCRGR